MKPRHPFLRSPRTFMLALALLLTLTACSSRPTFSNDPLPAPVPGMPSISETPVTMMIDPGHGGYDPGVMSGSLHEADLALDLGRKLRSTLEKQGVSVGMTRETDIDYAPSGTRGSNSKRADLNRRIEMTAAREAKIFISLHANVSDLATRGGAEVFYSDNVPGAKQLALGVQQELHKLPEMSKRDAKPARYYLLREQSIPALIIECGYLNITGERERLSSPGYQQQIADAVTRGVVAYLQQAPPN